MKKILLSILIAFLYPIMTFACEGQIDSKDPTAYIELIENKSYCDGNPVFSINAKEKYRGYLLTAIMLHAYLNKKYVLEIPIALPSSYTNPTFCIPDELLDGAIIQVQYERPGCKWGPYVFVYENLSNLKLNNRVSMMLQTKK
jgi:hypothetical protein